MFYYRKNFLEDNEFVIDNKYGDVNGDNKNDNIYLVGKKDNTTLFIRDIRIVIESNNEIHNINLNKNSGYNPKLSLFNFNNKSLDIVISIDSGESGGSNYYYLYSYLNNIERKLFDFEEFNNQYKYDVMYLDNYRVQITNTTLNKRYIIYIGNRDINYLSSIYKPNGTLLKPTIGYVLGLDSLYPIDIDRNGIYEILTLNRIIGLNNTDTIGYVVTYLRLGNNKFEAINDNQYIRIHGI